ncbi:farnesol dehydrogenase-like [Photinus pyralis]|uniref:Dehydrogenase n=1 Tax=Photinus pyralis TaxID=7054 RepID=A0A1Y1KKM2_PHOPY|nr:farnesol dehydrogenase-like [Photinus pyralis]
MNRWEGKVAIVTGTTSGIGSVIAEQLVDVGLTVVGLARRKELGEELARTLEGRKGRYYHLTADVAKEEDVLNAYKWIGENLGPVHVLVNNAGVLRPTSLCDGNTTDWKSMLDLNVVGLCMMTREAVRCMKANKVDGHIVHINSTSGHTVPVPVAAHVYAASKFGVTALTEALRQELVAGGSRIKISSVSPGLTESEGNPLPREVLANIPMLKGKDVADAISYIISTPPHVQVHDIVLRAIF